MKQLVKKIVFGLIYVIEKIEYRHMRLNPNDNDKKIIEEASTDIKILSDTGYVDVNKLFKTQPYRHWVVLLDNGLSITGADNHILFDINHSEVFIKNLSVGDMVMTKFGASPVIGVTQLPYETSMFDLEVNSIDHRYYANNILSHNTVCSGITLLHFVLFNNNKNALVTANKLDTAVEVLDKMREIYQRLPFFLQQGILNWNQKFMLFENKSKIKGFATTKTASIGQAADFLYLDEFAYLPDNIAHNFYKSVFPTVSNIENSKIIITSTPNGFNLFHKLLTDAEKPEGEKSSYMAKRVYWYQVPKRHVTYIRLNPIKLDELSISKEEIYDYLGTRYPDNKREMVWNDELKKWIINVYNTIDCTEEDITRETYNDVKFPEFSDITTWKKETIKDIGGEEAFNQEYDLRFINESRSLLDETLLDEFKSVQVDYEYIPISELSDQLKFDYLDLKWNLNEYDVYLRKSYKIILSVDIAEGLGQDYSIINIFKVECKDRTRIEKDSHRYTNLMDFYRITQIGLYRCNLVSVEQFAELLYLIAFENFDPDNVKIIVEMNTYGGELILHLPHVFEGHNNYGSYVFLKYKHRIDAVEEQIGIKVYSNKNLLVKAYQERIMDRSILISNPQTILELTTFIKHTTSAGNVVYRADGSSHDDIAMTVVHSASVFVKSQFREIVEELHDDNPDVELKKFINDKLNIVDGSDVTYSQLSEIRNRFSHSRRVNEARKGWNLR